MNLSEVSSWWRMWCRLRLASVCTLKLSSVLYVEARFSAAYRQRCMRANMRSRYRRLADQERCLGGEGCRRCQSSRESTCNATCPCLGWQDATADGTHYQQLESLCTNALVSPSQPVFWLCTTKRSPCATSATGCSESAG